MTSDRGLDSGCERQAQFRLERRWNRLERRYRRLLALYPKDHRREHAEEMVGVLLAVAAAEPPGRGWKPIARLARFGQRTADGTDLVTGAFRIRGRAALNRVRRSRWFSRTVRDLRWGDALAVVSVIAPLLLLVAALAEFNFPQAVASGITRHPHGQVSFGFDVADLPLLIGAPLISALAFGRMRRIAGVAALATALSQLALGVPGVLHAFRGYASPAVAFTVLLASMAAAALLISPGPARGLELLTWWGATLVGLGAVILSGFSVGSDAWFGSESLAASSTSPHFTAFSGQVAGLPADLLIAGVLIVAAAACLRAPVSRRVLVLLTIPVIPYAVLWQEKLTVDLVGTAGVIPFSVPMLYLPPLILACVIVAGTQLARRRATGRARQLGSAASSAGPPGAVSA